MKQKVDTENIEVLRNRIKSLERENIALRSDKEVYQAALRQNLNVMRNLFDDTGFGMLLIDFDGTIIRSNDLFNHLVGYTSGEILTMNFYQFFHPANTPESSIDPFLSSTSSEKHFKKILKKNGSAIFVKINTAISHDLYKKPKGIFVMVEDVTDKTRMEKVRSALYKISKATNNTRDVNDLFKKIRQTIHLVFSESNVFLALYDKVTQTFKFPFSDYNDTEQNQVSWEHHPLSYQVYTTGKSRLLKKEEIEILAGHKISKIPNAWMAVPLKVEGNTIGVLGLENYQTDDVYLKNDLETFEFISTHIAMAIERKLNEHQVKLEKAYFENLYQNSPEAIAIISPSGIIKNINNEFTHLFGYPYDECIGKSISILLPEESYRNESNDFRYNTFNNQRQLIETVRKRKDGNIFDVSILSTPIIIDEQTQLAYIIYRDITQRKEAERKLSIAKEKAEESDRLKSAFLSNMSHEIRTPLNAIVGFSSLLSSQRADDPEQRRNYVEHITSSSDNLVKLIDNIIDISKIESGQVEIRKDEFALRTLLDEQYELFNRRYLRHGAEGVNFHKDYEFLNGLEIHSDVSRLQQVISILLDNAFKFTSRGNITLGCRKQDQKVSIYVKDEGIGIANHDLDKIFDRFVKIEDDKSKLFRGTGIGLYIAKSVIKYLEGDIRVESVHGKGSTFVVDLPAISSTVSPVEATTTETATREFQGTAILIVEDTPSNYVFLEAVLDSTGAELAWAKCGMEALELMKNQHFDVILMDIALPDISGHDVTREIRKTNSTIPIIAQTAFSSQAEKNKCLEAGCNDYLAKPIREKDLRASIKNMLR